MRDISLGRRIDAYIMSGYLLGIDLGTTGIKVAIFDVEGKLVCREYEQNRYLQNVEGAAEQNPKDWWHNCCNAIRRIISRSKSKETEIISVGVCGFHHCPVFLDSMGEPTRPTIVTHDTRLSESYKYLEDKGILRRIIELSGSLVTAGHFPSIYSFILNNDRAAVENTRWIISAKDYIRFRLTGEVGTEICDATGTNLIAMPQERWSNSLCEILEVPLEKLPSISESCDIAGAITKEAARETGLKQNVPVVFGGGDSHCALLGLGVVESGEIGMLLGTNSTIRACFKGFFRYGSDKVWKQKHVVPEMYTASSSSMAGSSVLSWFKDNFISEFETSDPTDSYEKLESVICNIPPGCNGLLFHPYIFGERAPFLNLNARGSFMGISYLHGKSHFARSIMEGVAYNINNCVDVIKGLASKQRQEINSIRIGESGGGRSKTWRQIISDVIGFPLTVMETNEPGCFGAALLSGIGVGVYDGHRDAIRKTVKVKNIVSPNRALHIFYRKQIKKFNKTFQVLKPILY